MTCVKCGPYPPRYVCAIMEALDPSSLIDELQHVLRAQLQRAEQLEQLPLEVLLERPAPKAWSVLEIIEHLNISSGHYHERLQRIYAKASGSTHPNSTFVPGRWGQKFTLGMRPLADGTLPEPMRTLWFFEPKAAAAKGGQCIITFRAMLEKMIVLLDQARVQGLDGARITSTLGPVFRFKPGDAFRFAIAHQQRHFVQIERTLNTLEACAVRASGTV